VEAQLPFDEPDFTEIKTGKYKDQRYRCGGGELEGEPKVDCGKFLGGWDPAEATPDDKENYSTPYKYQRRWRKRSKLA